MFFEYYKYINNNYIKPAYVSALIIVDVIFFDISHTPRQRKSYDVIPFIILSNDVISDNKYFKF